MFQALKAQPLEIISAQENFLKSKFPYLFISAILILLAFLQARLFPQITFPLDDAYITLHNVQVLHQGYDLNYPGVSPLQGSTSIIHLFLVSLFAYVMPLLQAQQLVMWLNIFIYAMGVVRLTKIFKLPYWQSFSLVFLALCSANLIYQLLNGLETSLTLAAMIWSFVLVSQPLSKSRRISSAMLWGVMPFIRPELAILSGLLWFYQIKIYRQQQLSTQQIFHYLLQDTSIMLIAASPWLIWNLLSTGWFLPNTMTAKLAFMSEVHLPLIYKLEVAFIKILFFLKATGLGLTIFGLLLLCNSVGRLYFIFIAILLGLYTFFIPYELADNYWRYLTLLVPCFLFGGILALVNPQREIRLLANVFLFLGVLQTAFMIPSHWQFYFKSMKYSIVQLTDLANWCNDHLPKNSILLVHDTGFLAYATSFHLVDLVGLKSPEVVRYYQKYSLPNNGEYRMIAIAKIIAAEKPEYIVMLPRWDNMFHISRDLPFYGYQLKNIYVQNDGYEVDEFISQKVH